MSFSWSILGKDGEDLCKKYGIHHQALNLAYYGNGDTESRHSLMDIRSAFIQIPFKEDYRPAAMTAVAAVQKKFTRREVDIERA